MDHVDTTSIRAMIPSVLPIRNGWLAISPRTAPINVAVKGTTEAEARELFRDSANAWARLHDIPDEG